MQGRVGRLIYSAAFRAKYPGGEGMEELKDNNYSLVPSRYIEFVDRDSAIDYHKVLTETASAVSDLLKRQKENDDTLRNALKQLGYEC